MGNSVGFSGGLLVRRTGTLDIERLANPLKPSDSRSKAYVREYGNRCWEADILAADVITAAIDRVIPHWLNVEAWQRGRDRDDTEATVMLKRTRSVAPV